MKKKHNILFCYVSIAIFLSLLVLVGCPSSPNNNDNDTIATPTSSKQRLRLNTTNKTLILSFNKNIKNIKTPKNIIVYKKSKNTPASPKNDLAKDTHTASAVKGKLVITLKNKFTAGESFYVQMPKDTIIYKDDTSNAHPITSPMVTVPSIFVTKVEIDKAILTLSFNISLSDKYDSKIEVYKNNTPLTTSTDYTVAIDNADATKVKITLKAVKLNEGDKYKVQFKPNAVKDTNGIGNDAIATNEVSVMFPPALQSKVLERTGNTLTVTFKKAIKVTDKNKIEVYKNNTPLTTSTDYTVAIDGTNTTKIKITLTAAVKLNEGDKYKVQFKPNAVKDTNGIGNDAITTNEVSVLLPPALQSKVLERTENTLIVTFKKAIKTTDKNKIEVYKNNTPLTTSTDYTVAIDDTNTTKIKITLTASKLNEGDKYKVQFKPNAVKDTNGIGNDAITTNEVSVMFPPALASNDLALNGNTLTVTFKKAIKTTDKNKIEVYKNNTPLTTSTDYTVAIDDTNTTKIKITLTASKLNEGDKYKVQFKPNAVKDTNGIGNDAITTNEVSVMFPPALASNDLALNGNTLTVTFKNAIKITDKNKIEVYKNNTPLTTSMDYTVAIDDTDTTKVKITLTAAELNDGDKYKVQFKPNAVKDTNGIGNDAIATNEVSVLLPPALQSKTLERTGNTLTVTFKNAIKITEKNKIEVYKNNTPLTTSTDYTVAIDGTDATKVKITLTTSKLNEGDTYKVQFKPNAVQSTNGIDNDAITTNKVSVMFPPALQSKTLEHTGNTLIITFKKAIKITDKNKIEVYKNNTPLTTSTDYTVAIDDIDATKVKITLTAAELNDGDKYKVQFKPNAVQGANGIGNDAIATNEVSVLLPPALQSKTLERTGNTLTVTFKNAIKITDKNKINVYKSNKNLLTLSKDYTVAIDGTDATKVKITLTTSKLNEGDTYKVQFKPNAVQSTNGIDNDAITTNKVSVMFPPALQSKTLEHTGNTLIITFKKAIKITDKNKIEVYKNNTPLTTSTDYTVAIDNTDTTKVKITLTASPSLNQKYQVKFLASAVRDIANNQPNKFMETDEYDIIRIWKHVTASAKWTNRSNHTSLVFNDKIWVLGGNDDSNENDVWSSSDGKKWTKITDAAGWTARCLHTSVVFDDKIWVLGGWDNSNKNDVWSSSNGKDWTKITDAAGWTARYGHTSVVFDDKIWVLGGFDNSNKNDVWSSSNGKDWTKITDAAGWTNRSYHASVVFDDKIWVLGGNDDSRKNDVWNSSDGKTWTKITDTAGWTARSYHVSVVFDDKIWVLGGWDGIKKNDVWNSSDGKTWNQETAKAGWTGRSDHTTVVLDEKIWVLGGSDDSRKNDVWTYGLP